MWSDLSGELEELFSILVVPTYECVGDLGHSNSSVILKPMGSVTFERTRRIGRDPENKRTWEAQWRSKNREAERARHKAYRARLKEAAGCA